MLAELKQCFLEAYDDNRDGKIDIREVRYLHSTLVNGEKVGIHSFYINKSI